MVPIEPSPQSALPVSGGSDQPLDHQQNVAPPKKEGLGSVIFGFVLALIALGLPMIGVTVNLWLGAIPLAVAFGFMVYGFWKWERSANWNPILRVGTVIFGAMLYFSLIGIQIRTQYKQDHPVQIDPHEHKAGMTISFTGWGSLPPNKVFATINVEPAPPQNAPFHLLLVCRVAEITGEPNRRDGSKSGFHDARISFGIGKCKRGSRSPAGCGRPWTDFQARGRREVRWPNHGRWFVSHEHR
jgi:hypothetical protein